MYFKEVCVWQTDKKLKITILSKLFVQKHAEIILKFAENFIVLISLAMKKICI